MAACASIKLYYLLAMHIKLNYILMQKYLCTINQTNYILMQKYLCIIKQNMQYNNNTMEDLYTQMLY